MDKNRWLDEIGEAEQALRTAERCTRAKGNTRDDIIRRAILDGVSIAEISRHVHRSETGVRAIRDRATRDWALRSVSA